MRKATLTLLLLLIVTLGYSQTLTKKIATIRAEVEKINKGSGYRIKTLSNEEFLEEMPDGGGELKAYYKNGELVKMVERIYLSSCINTTVYYVKNGQLIFTYTQVKEWFYDEKTNTLDSKRLNLKMECRFYFEHAKVIKSILKGTSRCSGSPNATWALNYITAFKRYQKKLSN